MPPSTSSRSMAALHNSSIVHRGLIMSCQPGLPKVAGSTTRVTAPGAWRFGALVCPAVTHNKSRPRVALPLKLSPEGELLYTTTGNGQTSSLWVENLRSRARTKIADRVVKRAFAPAQNGVYYFSPAPNSQTELWFYSTSTMRAALIANSDRIIDGGVTLSPNGRYLYYTQVDAHAQDLVLAPEFWKP